MVILEILFLGMGLKYFTLYTAPEKEQVYYFYATPCNNFMNKVKTVVFYPK